jgi:hypothetical protein
LPCMHFGKYKGYPFTEIPEDYLRWVLRTCCEDRPRLRKQIEEFLGTEESTPSEQATAISDLGSRVSQWYREMNMKFHPDRFGSHEAMTAINTAYLRLKELLNL